MLIELLERLLDKQPYLPQLQALGSILLLLGFGAWLLTSNQDPEHEDEVAAARAIMYNAIIKKRELDVRGEYQVWIEQQQKLIQLPETRFFYETIAYKNLIDAMANNVFPYAKASPCSLPVQAQAGDSIKKKSGSLTIRVIRGKKSYIFQYKCPYHSYLL